MHFVWDIAEEEMNHNRLSYYCEAIIQQQLINCCFNKTVDVHSTDDKTSFFV